MTRTEHLFSILTELSDDLIEEAALPLSPAQTQPAAPAKIIRWKPWAALAACLLLVVGVWRFFPRMGSTNEAPGAMPPSAAEPMESAPAPSGVPGEASPSDGSPDNYGESMKPNPSGDPAAPSHPAEGPTEGPEVGGPETPLPYDLTSNEITIYTPVPDLWQSTQVVDKAAKRLCTVLTISEPESAEPPGDIPIAWLDFGNGTIVALFPGDYAIVYSCTEEFLPSLQPALEPHLQGVFPGLQDTLLQVLEDPAETWDTQSDVNSAPN